MRHRLAPVAALLAGCSVLPQRIETSIDRHRDVLAAPAWRPEVSGPLLAPGKRAFTGSLTTAPPIGDESVTVSVASTGFAGAVALGAPFGELQLGLEVRGGAYARSNAVDPRLFSDRRLGRLSFTTRVPFASAGDWSFFVLGGGAIESWRVRERTITTTRTFSLSARPDDPPTVGRTDVMASDDALAGGVLVTVGALGRLSPDLVVDASLGGVLQPVPLTDGTVSTTCTVGVSDASCTGDGVMPMWRSAAGVTGHVALTYSTGPFDLFARIGGAWIPDAPLLLDPATVTAGVRLRL